MYVILNDELYHHGIKGQKWGVRRFQNADGSLKPAGEKRYGSGTKKDYKNAKAESRKKSIDDLGKLKDKNDIEAVTKLAAEYDNRNKKIKDTYASEKAAKAEAKKQQKAVKDFEKKVNKNWVKTYNKATKQFNVDIQKLNSNPKYSNDKLNDPKVHKAYMKEVSNLWKKLYSDQMKKDFGDHPDSKAKDWQSSVPFYNNYD